MKYWVLVLVLWGLSACNAGNSGVPTAVVIVKPLATVVLSATPNPTERQATQAAITATPLPPTPTLIPTATAYIGVFIGQAERAGGFQSFTEALFAPNTANLDHTPNAQRCITPIDARVVGIWQENRAISQRMGCPIQASFGFFGKVQLFESGAMYLQPDIRAVWAIIPVLGIGRYVYLEAPPPFEGVAAIPPAGGIVPVGDFASVWLSVNDLPQRMGFALTAEQDIAIYIQRFDGGTFLLDGSAGQGFALIADGTLYGPFSVKIDPIITPTVVDGP